jgi:hypothetical protein
MFMEPMTPPDGARDRSGLVAPTSIGIAFSA